MDACNMLPKLNRNKEKNNINKNLILARNTRLLYETTVQTKLMTKSFTVTCDTGGPLNFTPFTSFHLIFTI